MKTPTNSLGEEKNRTVGDCQTSQNVEASPKAVSRCITLSHHSQNLLQFLNEDRERRRFCDVSVSVGGKIHYAHKAVLAHGSSYFHAEFSKNPGASQITLDHVDTTIFQHLLEFLYTSECTVEEADIPTLTVATRFLDMMDVLKLLSEGQSHAPTRFDLTSEDLPTCPKDIEGVRNGVFRRPEGVNSETTIQATNENQSTAQIRRSSRRRRALKHLTDYELDTVITKKAKTHKASQEKAGSEANAEVAREADDINFQDSNDDAELDDDDTGMGPVQFKDGSTPDQKMEEKKNHTKSKAPRRIIPEYPEGLAPVIFNSSNKRTLKCPKCDKVFDRAAKYESHTRVHTGEKPFQCDVCLQCYSTKSNLNVHKKKHDNGTLQSKKEHQCSFCHKLHASKKTLAKHVKRFHPDQIQESKKKKRSEGWKCAVCLKTFTRRPHLQEHMILHSQELPFKCSFCDEHFRSRFARMKHQEKLHLGPFPCEICGRQFNDSGNKRRHVEYTHGGKRKWICCICGKSVRERATLREHMRIHSGERPHLCSVCGQSFRHGSSYRLHLRVHHNDKRYKCVQCGKTFIRQDHLSKHQKIHSGEKAHQCEECGKCFRRHDHLTVHYKTVHLGQKVWQRYKAAVHQCEVCKKEFKGKSSLESHFRTHSGEKPHKCPECNQAFRIKKTLTKHMVIHSDDRPFNCPYCTATFKRKDKLKYHVDHVHSTRYTAQPDRTLCNKPDTSPYEESAKTFSEAKPTGQSSPPHAGTCAPLTLVPVPMDGVDQREVQRTVQAQRQQQRYQSATELALLEKYTLHLQPANVVHPLRPDQMLDPREQSYLGSLLGLESTTSVSSVANSENAHELS